MMMNADPIPPDPPSTAGFDREGPWPPAARSASGDVSRRAFLHRAAASALAVGAAAGPVHAGEAGPQALGPAGRTGHPPGSSKTPISSSRS
jgi:hypothetical protein